MAIVSRGPGLSNAMVALHSAYPRRTPLVVLSATSSAGTSAGGAAGAELLALLSDMTKSVIEVIDPDQASEAIARAFHTAESATPGPVAVILPEDIFDRQTDAPMSKPRPRVSSPRRARATCAHGRDAGGGGTAARAGRRRLQWESAQDESVLHDLAAKQWNLPIVPTHRRPQLFDANEAHYGGYMGIRVPKPQLDTMKRTDLIVAWASV